MTKIKLQQEWQKLTNEIHKMSKISEQLKDKKMSFLGDILVCAQILLCKIEARDNAVFNEMIYKKTINFYRAQIQKICPI